MHFRPRNTHTNPKRKRGTGNLQLLSSLALRVSVVSGRERYISNYLNCKRAVENGDWLRADIGRNCGKNSSREVPVPFFHGARHSPSEKGDRHRRQTENSGKTQGQGATEPVPIFGLPAYSLSIYHSRLGVKRANVPFLTGRGIARCS